MSYGKIIPLIAAAIREHREVRQDEIVIAVAELSGKVDELFRKINQIEQNVNSIEVNLWG